MKIFILVLIITTSGATFHNLKPNKLYKTLVEPLVDGALQGFFTRGILDPIGHFLTGGKYRHHKKYKYHNDHESHYYGDPYHYNEHEFYLHHGGPPAIYHVHHCGSRGDYDHHHEGHSDSPGYYTPESFYDHIGHYGSVPYAGGFPYGGVHHGAEERFGHYHHY
ncbi:uncharacterized protein [Euwallacea fornicatus]|uniref:uncharacterized protein n=1 Tax=Euwallacea fornicatus TaxID=995702 RepID=UPI00338E9DA9